MSLWWSVSGGERRRSRWAIALVVTVACGAAGLVLWNLPGAIRFAIHAPSGFWAMALLAVLVDLPIFGRRELAVRVRLTLSVCFTFAIFVLWGAAPAIVVQALAGVSLLAQRTSWLARIYGTARLVWALAAAELVVLLLEPRPITEPGTGLTGQNMIHFLPP